MKIKKIHVIINPASGKFEPILSILNTTLQDSNIDWDISITRHAGDGTRIAKEQLKSDIDVLAVYGGDGTQIEVIEALIGSELPIAILPGGTANVIAAEMGIPTDLKEACELLKKATHFRKIDIAHYKKHPFVLRSSSGFETHMVKGAKRSAKNHWGRLAYVASAFKALKKIRLIKYEITVDGVQNEIEGVSCVVANSGNIGIQGIKLEKTIHVDDGLLDVLVIKKLDFSFFRYAYHVLRGKDPSEDCDLVAHLQGKEILIDCKPPQKFMGDGEKSEDAPIRFTIEPKAVRILVPHSSKSSDSSLKQKA